MSNCITGITGVKSRKARRCVLCGSRIEAGEQHNVRTGVNSDGWWKMRMHVECHAYEEQPGVIDWDWYEDVSQPAFERKDALEFMAAKNL